MTAVSAATRRIWLLEHALERIANGEVPLKNYGEMIQAVQGYARWVLDNNGESL